MSLLRLFLIGLACCAGCGPRLPALEEGHEALADREFQKAREIYDAILAKDSQNVSALTGRGGALFQLGELDLALADLNAAIALDPIAPVAYFNRAGLFDQREQHPESLADFEKAISLGYDSADIRNRLGVQYSKIGKPEEAIKQYSAAIQLDPKYWSSYVNRGAQRVARDEIDEGIEDFSQAIELSPQSFAPYVLRANAYQSLGQSEKASADRATALRLEPGWQSMSDLELMNSFRPSGNN